MIRRTACLRAHGSQSNVLTDRPSPQSSGPYKVVLGVQQHNLCITSVPWQNQVVHAPLLSEQVPCAAAGNEFYLYTNSDASAQRLGGWDSGD